MADEVVAGSGGGQQEGGQAASAIDWSKGGAEHFGGFKESLGDIGKDKSLEPIKDFKELTQSYINAQKMIGGSIRLPAKDLKPEDREKAVNDIISKLRTGGDIESIPESWEKYEVKMPEEEGFQVNQPLYDSFRQAAHKLGTTPSIAQGLFDWYLNFQSEADRQEQGKFVEMKSGLKKEMGGLYARRMEAARRWVGKYIGEKGDEIISQLPPEIGVVLVKAFAAAGEPMLEEAIISGDLAGFKGKEEQIKGIETEILTMMNDKNHPLNDISKTGHKEAVEKYTELQQNLIKLRGKKK